MHLNSQCHATQSCRKVPLTGQLGYECMLHVLVQSMKALIHMVFEQWATNIELAALRQGEQNAEQSFSHS